MVKTTAQIEDLNTYSIDRIDCQPPEEFYLDRFEARTDLRKQDLTICQEYILPIPYLCQIYHLLNLKHLEVVHGFSLNGLKIGNIGCLEATGTGGKIKFETMLVSSFNFLRIWRQPVVEVELTLHDPYTIELNIGIYRDKKISILFNILPLGATEHKLSINIYSSVRFFKPILQILLHGATCLTLLEDMPYLRQLAKNNPHHLVKAAQSSNCQAMQLFNRFVDLYGSNLE
ncbi:MAG: hypothetical protein LH613_14920 [Chamaesiphon sp.]|nr:hypothetical protein [Chamaesiphon sp.]